MESASAADLAYQALRRAILDKAIAPGTRLPEDELAAQFGVSRTPIRAVLARLQNEGLVAAGARRTACVAEPGLGEARKVFEVRRVLEREAVRLAAQRWAPAHERRLEQIVRQEEQARKAGDARAAIRLAGDFHLALGEIADNFLLGRYLGETVSRCSLILAVHSRPHSEDCAISEHRQILERLRAGKAHEAAAAMDEHIEAIARRASLDAEPPQSRGLSEVLSHYAGELRPAAAPRKAGARRTAARKRA
jgi:DNA-binding GntR family transcriptional regulator